MLPRGQNQFRLSLQSNSKQSPCDRSISSRVRKGYTDAFFALYMACSVTMTVIDCMWPSSLATGPCGKSSAALLIVSLTTIFTVLARTILVRTKNARVTLKRVTGRHRRFATFAGIFRSE